MRSSRRVGSASSAGASRFHRPTGGGVSQRAHSSTARGGGGRAADGVLFAGARGEALGIVGETGCGTSTLAKAILGILPPGTIIEGSIRFAGADLATLGVRTMRPMRGKDIALIFQDPTTRLDPLMTIEEHFHETIRAHEDASAKEARERARGAVA